MEVNDGGPSSGAYSSKVAVMLKTTISTSQKSKTGATGDAHRSVMAGSVKASLPPVAKAGPMMERYDPFLMSVLAQL